jgi:shikimate kinase
MTNPLQTKAWRCEVILSAINKPVLIVGMMGTGKSHLGRKLAELLKFKFRDSDKLIEHEAGLSINDIFEKYGEGAFRKAEEKAVLSLINEPASVIATGGGAVMNPVIFKAIKEKTISVWLRADIENIIIRMQRAKDRPLLKTGNPDEVLRRLQAEREPFYAQANIVIDSVEGSVEDTLEALVEALFSGLSAAEKQGSL